MRFALRFVVVVIVLFITLFLFLLSRTLLHGNTAKIANNEYSFPNDKLTTQTSTPRKDSIIINQSVPVIKKLGKINHKEKRIKLATEQKKEKKDTLKFTSQFNLPNATFNGPSQIGNGNTQKNDYTVKQRYLSFSLLTRILKAIGDKKEPIEIIFNGGKESANLAEQVYKSLHSYRYKVSDTISEFMPAVKYDTIDVATSADKKRTLVRIYPASNVR